MPRKVFVAGEILTAADVNTNLMDQAVMVFDDATARTTAIPTPVEGMVTYLKDTDAVEKFDGDDFVNVDTGGLVAVKSALFTGVQAVSLNAGDSFAVTGLSITHAMANASNKLIISAYLGVVANSNGRADVGLLVRRGANDIAQGDSVGSRKRVIAGGKTSGSQGNFVTNSLATTFVFAPGNTQSNTYTVRAANILGGTATVFVNRGQSDTDNSSNARGSSGFIIQEVAV